ncbi:carboxymuconolactone decarboxylase family protein [Pseudonocardia pini]|uniref:carboxymuconolactone decarboxylase family protein n=1 Tax=Pseudonocardia pini TaxID=2758030 RepID=UPI0028A96F01|nr:carboxymuconolactone decarboxylase family protein [Pseudonocardia pini]
MTLVNDLTDQPSDGRAALDAGDAVRRAVLGDEHVERSRAKATPFSRPLQDLVTEYCWGTIWTRPGLERPTRSLLNIAMLTALGKPDELRLHVRGALNNGCTVEQIQEVLLQAAVYCGVPAALEASRAAQEVVAEYGDD